MFLDSAERHQVASTNQEESFHEQYTAHEPSADAEEPTWFAAGIRTVSVSVEFPS